MKSGSAFIRDEFVINFVIGFVYNVRDKTRISAKLDAMHSIELILHQHQSSTVRGKDGLKANMLLKIFLAKFFQAVGTCASKCILQSGPIATEI